MCWLARSDSHGRGGGVRVMGEQAGRADERVEVTLVTPADKILVLPESFGMALQNCRWNSKIEVPHHSKVEARSI